MESDIRVCIFMKATPKQILSASKVVLQSILLKRSSDEQINKFIIANLISGIILIIWLSDE